MFHKISSFPELQCFNGTDISKHILQYLQSPLETAINIFVASVLDHNMINGRHLRGKIYINNQLNHSHGKVIHVLNQTPHHEEIFLFSTSNTINNGREDTFIISSSDGEQSSE
jgi:hypothetical protein